MVSAVDMAKRALVSLLHRLALLYAVTLGVKRDSPDAEVKRAFRKVCKKSHPDRGGNKAHQQELNSAYAAWETAQRAAEEKAASRVRHSKGGQSRDQFQIGVAWNARRLMIFAPCFRMHARLPVVSYVVAC